MSQKEEKVANQLLTALDNVVDQFDLNPEELTNVLLTGLTDRIGVEYMEAVIVALVDYHKVQESDYKKLNLVFLLQESAASVKH